MKNDLNVVMSKTAPYTISLTNQDATTIVQATVNCTFTNPNTNDTAKITSDPAVIYSTCTPFPAEHWSAPETPSAEFNLGAGPTNVILQASNSFNNSCTPKSILSECRLQTPHPKSV